MADLKSILSAAMSPKEKKFSVGKIEVKKEDLQLEEKDLIAEENLEKKIEDKFSSSIDNNYDSVKKVEESIQNKTKEVPEDVLRKVLHPDLPNKN